MATPLTGERQVIYDQDVNFNSAVSESLLEKIAKAALFGQDVSEISVPFHYGGFFRTTSISDDANTHIITADSEIRSYVISTHQSGVGTNRFDIEVYNTLGASLGSLFSATPFMLATSDVKENYVGRDVENALDLKNTTGLNSFSVGSLGSITLLKGYQLKSKILTNGADALNGSIQLVLGRV